MTLGVINLPHGLVQMDAPPSPEDARTWRAALLSLGGGSERLLVNLDAHPDRTLGARAMDCTVVCPREDRPGLPQPAHHLQGPGGGYRRRLGKYPWPGERPLDIAGNHFQPRR